MANKAQNDSQQIADGAGRRRKLEPSLSRRRRSRLQPLRVKEPAHPAVPAERQRLDLATVSPARVGNTAPADNRTDNRTAVATLTAEPSQAELITSMQTELRRVGCFSGALDGEWNAASRHSLSLFTRYAGTTFDVKIAAINVLDSIKPKQSRVCPLECARGYKADGDRCTQIVCGDGSFINDDNQCEKRRYKSSKIVTSDRDVPRERERQVPAHTQANAGSGRTGGSGQVYCDSSICRPVARGCHLEYRGGGGPGNSANAEVCN
jgi:hypothetical protein